MGDAPLALGRRIVVTGLAGSGKSTFSLALCVKTGLPVIHLDLQFWKPGWVAPSETEWREKQYAVLAGDAWIAEGNYHETLDLRLERADTVVAALVCAARVQAKELASLLTSLAETTRDDARMRVQIDVDRARTRTAAKLVMLVAATTLGLVLAFSRDYLAIYSTSNGQFVLLAVAGIFATGLWLMERLAIVDPPERFVIRKTRRTMDAG